MLKVVSLMGAHLLGTLILREVLDRGTPCPHICLYFVLKFLARLIYKDPEIQGFTFNNVQVKQILYADDMTLFIRDPNSLKKVGKLFDSFARNSGLKINKEKTFILLLGPSQNENIAISFGKVVQIVKILGIYFFFRC